MRNDRIYLTGYRGTGKTTVAGLISEQLGCGWVDLDPRIESRAGQTIRELFEEGGEALFRDWETRCLEELVLDDSSPTVISLGGGAILRTQNREIIQRSGRCLWLTARPATIALRLADDATTTDRRPALTDLTPEMEIRAVLASREPLYRQIADLTLATDDKTPQELAGEAVLWFRKSR